MCQFLIGMIRQGATDGEDAGVGLVSIPYRYDTPTVFKPFLHRLSIQIVKIDVKFLPKVCQPLSILQSKSKQNQAFSDICQFLHLVRRLFAQFFLFFPSRCIIFSYQIPLKPLYFLALEVDKLTILIQKHYVGRFVVTIVGCTVFSSLETSSQ